jgi:hypothetical protein
MSQVAISALQRAVDALTCPTELSHPDGRVIAAGDAVPLLRRSIAHELNQIERSLGLCAKGNTYLSGFALSIDEALLAIAEAQAALAGTPS